MKLFKPAVATAAIAGVALGGILLAGPASADPVSPGYVAVGSDTLQASMDALTNGSNLTGPFVRVVAPAKAVGNFDAFGSTGIQALGGGLPATKTFGRPAGSGAGLAALAASIRGRSTTTYYSTNTSLDIPHQQITDQIDIARSSSGVGTHGDDTNGLLQYVPYARDAVAFAYKSCSATDGAILAGLTTAQLTDLYKNYATEGDLPQWGTAPNQFTIYPKLPQTASGTRSFFLTAISVSTVGGAVRGRVNTTPITPENDATVLGCDEIIPFSVGNWVAQANGVISPNTTTVTGAGLGSPTGTQPFTGSAPSVVPNAAYYSNSTWGRNTYLIVEYARVNPASPSYDAGLASLVSTNPANAQTSLVSFNAAANQPGAVKAKYGFVAVSDPTPIRAYNSADLNAIVTDQNGH